jgi:hypothetical protein
MSQVGSRQVKRAHFDFSEGDEHVSIELPLQIAVSLQMDRLHSYLVLVLTIAGWTCCDLV